MDSGLACFMDRSDRFCLSDKVEQWNGGKVMREQRNLGRWKSDSLEEV